MSTIRKKGKAWQVQVRQANRPAMTKSFSRKIDAIHWAQTIEGLLRDESPTNMRRDRQITLREAIDKYRDTISNYKKKREEKCSRLKRIAKIHFLEEPLSKITFKVKYVDFLP